MNYPPDLIEQQVADLDQAWKFLNSQSMDFKSIFSLWQNWYEDIVSNSAEKKVITDALVISYARMALRNGSLSIKCRSYHNETHIDDLLLRLMAVSKLPMSKNIPEYGWSLLSLFMSCHDLRQSEKNDSSVLIGDNEQASYQEVERILKTIDKKNIIRKEHKTLLKIMIHGSTFGQGEDTMGNIYKGNLVRYILNGINYFEEVDKEIAYLACDIDTANVSADLTDYSLSSISVYNEIQNISPNTTCAKEFFGKQQQLYFFELQRFNSKLGIAAFSQQKILNAPKIQKICNTINKLKENLTNEEVLKVYQQQISLLS